MGKEPPMNKETPIVKYDNRWWVLEGISKSGMATLWRNGQPCIIPENLIEAYEEERK